MKITHQEEKGFEFVHIEGEIEIVKDAETLISFIYDIVDEGKIQMVFDFSDIDYVFSGVIRILVQCYKKIEEKGGSLSIIEVNSRAFDALNLVGITSLIKIFPDREALFAELL